MAPVELILLLLPRQDIRDECTNADLIMGADTLAMKGRDCREKVQPI